MTPEEEAAVRADERLEVLRRVRNAAARMDHDPDNDPYLWGYGAGMIVRMLNSLVKEERELQGSPMRAES